MSALSSAYTSFLAVVALHAAAVLWRRTQYCATKHLSTALKWPEEVQRRGELVVVTRVHNRSAAQLADPVDVQAFVAAALPYAARVIVCIGYHEADTNKNLFGLQNYLKTLAAHLHTSLGSARATRVTLLPVTPWGSFTTALNAATNVAVDGGFAFIAFQSLEFRLRAETATRLLHCLAADEDLLVAGPALEGHEFLHGRQALRGRTCPWNTCAIWSLRHLAILGFPPLGDAYGTAYGGVEEVSAIWVAQVVRPQLRALLVRCAKPSDTVLQWQTDFEDAQRAAWHASKMRSKDERPAAQLQLIGGAAARGWVEHVEFDDL